MKIFQCMAMNWVEAFLCLALARSAVGAPCVDYSNYLRSAGSLDLPGGANEISLIDDLLFIASPGGYGALNSLIHVVDVSNAESPVLANALSVPGDIQAIDISGSHAFVAGDSGLQVIDVSNPDDLVIVGSMGTPSGGRDVRVSGNLAYLVIGAGLRIVDVSNPLAPAPLGFVSITGFPHDLEIAQDYAYVCAGSGLRVVDVSSSTAPAVIGSYDPGHFASAVDVVGEIVYLGEDLLSGGVVQLLDVSDPTSPAPIGEVPLSFIPFDIEFVKDKAYFVGANLEIYDASILTSLVRLGGIRSMHSSSIAISEGHAFMGHSSSLKIADVSNPENLSPLGSLEIPFYSPSIELGIGLAYVGNADIGGQGNGALHIVDLVDPMSPALLGSLTTPEVLGIALSGSNAVLACGESGLRIATVANPAAPAIIGACDTRGTAFDVEVSGGHAFIADGNSVQIMTIADPTNPQIVSSLTTGGFSNDLAVSANLVFVADGDAGFRIIDVSIPSNPVLVGDLDVDPPRVSSVAVSGDYAYVTSTEPWGSNHRMTVIACANPNAPEPVAFIEVDGGYGSKITVAGEIAYVSAAGLFAINISDPFDPRQIGQAETAGAVAANGEIVGVSLEGGGLATYPIQCGSEAVQAPGIEPHLADLGLASVRPNPFVEVTRISFSLNTASKVRLTVYDVSGRLVRALTNEVFPPGLHEISWNGRDERSARVSSGVYLVRMETPGIQETRRIVHLE